MKKTKRRTDQQILIEAPISGVGISKLAGTGTNTLRKITCGAHHRLGDENRQKVAKVLREHGQKMVRLADELEANSKEAEDREAVRRYATKQRRLATLGS